MELPTQLILKLTFFLRDESSDIVSAIRGGQQ